MGAYSAPPDTLAGGEGADCPLLKNPVPTVDHSVKHFDESLPALLKGQGKVRKSHVVWKVAALFFMNNI